MELAGCGIVDTSSNRQLVATNEHCVRWTDLQAVVCSLGVTLLGWSTERQLDLRTEWSHSVDCCLFASSTNIVTLCSLHAPCLPTG
jgi:hypothetical protein